MAAPPVQPIHPVAVEAPPELAGVSGVVRVHIGVGADGIPTEVHAVSGPAELHAAAEAAALRLTFPPAGEHVDLDVDFAFGDSAQNVDIEVVVEHTGVENQDTRSAVRLDASDLAASAGEDLSEVLSGVAGVAMAKGQSDVGKPIVRGFDERRLLLLVDGVRHAGQKWGADHAPEIDPMSAGSISVIRGPNGVRYGPDAIGGVILVEPPPLRDTSGWGGRLTSFGATNGPRGGAGVRLDGVPAALDQLSVRAEANFSGGASLQAPSYVLGNTASRTFNLGATARWTLVGGGEVTAAWRHHDLLAGVCHCALGDPVTAPSIGAPAGSETWQAWAPIEPPMQDVVHDLGLLRWTTERAWASLAHQRNYRREFEPLRGGVEEPSHTFTLRTTTLDGGSTPVDLPRWRVEVGGAGTYQENVVSGLALVPNHRSVSGGVHGVGRYKTGGSALEVGGRVDAMDQVAFLPGDEVVARVLGGRMDASTCEVTNDVGRCPGQWVTGSLTAGGVLAVGDHGTARLDVSTASRFPNADERFIDGTSPTSPVYAEGNPELGVETARGVAASMDWSDRWVDGELSAYVTFVNDAIGFEPVLGDAGQLTYVTTAQGAFPRWHHLARDVRVQGLDGALSIGHHEVVGLEFIGSAVRQQEIDSGLALPGTPADRLRSSVVVRPAIRGLRDTEFALGATGLARSTSQGEGLPPPDGAWLLDARAGTTLRLPRDRTLGFGLVGTNLLDAAYRESTSLLRATVDEVGRDVRLTVDATW